MLLYSIIIVIIFHRDVRQALEHCALVLLFFICSRRELIVTVENNWNRKIGTNQIPPNDPILSLSLYFSLFLSNRSNSMWFYSISFTLLSFCIFCVSQCNPIWMANCLHLFCVGSCYVFIKIRLNEFSCSERKKKREKIAFQNIRILFEQFIFIMIWTFADDEFGKWMCILHNIFFCSFDLIMCTFWFLASFSLTSIALNPTSIALNQYYYYEIGCFHLMNNHIPPGIALLLWHRLN